MTFFRKNIDHDEARYRELVYAYHYRVFIYIARKVKGRENIMDISQNVFFHLWKYRKSVFVSNPEPVIFNTCNQEISKFFKASQIQQLSSDLDVQDHKDDSEEAISSKIDGEERIRLVMEKIEELPALRKKIFTMNKLNGIAQKQIAVELQIPHHTVKYHIAEATLYLKDNTSLEI